MEAIEAEIERFLDKWARNDEIRGRMDVDLHFFMRTIMREHGRLVEPESYSPEERYRR
jgi:hypothetical protein